MGFDHCQNHLVFICFTSSLYCNPSTFSLQHHNPYPNHDISRFTLILYPLGTFFAPLPVNTSTSACSVCRYCPPLNPNSLSVFSTTKPVYDDNSIVAFDEVVGQAADGGCGDGCAWVAIVARWTDAAVGAKLDHVFGIFGAVA